MFINVKYDLLDGKTVLFSGTGCQVNGLKMFLGREFDNLFCVDIICHGVPSPFLWEKYIKYLENANNKKVRSVNFRCKEEGWESYVMKENAMFISKDADPYMQMFLRDYCLRPSCYNCKAKGHKQSDMTIADFWGINNVAPEMNDNKGISCVILRSEKAIKFFDQLCLNLHCKEVSYEDAVKENPSEFSSSKKPPERDAFYQDMNSMSFSELAQKYVGICQASILRRIIRKTKSIIGKKSKNSGGWDNYGIKFNFYTNHEESR